ncbi:MAG: tetratricopeptide repeat protein [Armatimonadetes bacterium]|nr:tetratricopeptide repeat protein [Armatimonadota bacterium]
MMGGQKQTRRRAVRLTVEALERMNHALVGVWDRDEREGKLTQEVRAELMGISLASANRVAARQGVDRATLILAFRSLGLVWSDSYCEFVERPDPGQPPMGGTEQVALSKTRTSRRRRWLILSVAAIVVCCTAVCFPLFVVPAIGAAVKNQNEWAVYIPLDDGTKRFHRGDFEGARTQIAKAVQIARRHELVAPLACAVRMAGDIAAAQGDFQEAKANYVQALELRRTLKDDVSQPAILEALGDIETKSGDLTSAEAHLRGSLEGYRRLKDRGGIAMASRDLGTLFFERGNLDAASSWFKASMQSLKGLHGGDMETDIHARQALVLRERGLFDDARAILASCLTYWRGKSHPRWVAQTEFQLGTVEVAAGNNGAAVQYFVRSRRGFSQFGDRAGQSACETWLERIRSSNRTAIARFPSGNNDNIRQAGRFTADP